MKDLETKQKVLEEIMSLMDDKEGEKLKSHPKLMAAKVEIGKPKELEGSEDEEALESPDEEAHEMSLGDKPKDEDDIDPEMMKKLIEMMNGK